MQVLRDESSRVILSTVGNEEAEMKVLLTAALALVLIAGTTRADSDDWWQGALIGGALGAIVGHNSHDIDTTVAIPAFAAAGALIGYGHDRGWFRHDGYYGYYDWHRPYRYYDPHSWYPRYHPRGYGNYRYYPPAYRKRSNRRRSSDSGPRHRAAPAAAPPDLHPGVETVKVPVTLASGLTIDLRILRVNGRFIGPRGEAYETLPTGKELAKRYVP